VGSTLYDYWQDIYERKILLLTVTLSAAVFAYLISIVLPPLYEAKVTFYAPANLNPPTYTGSDAAGRVAQGPFLPTPDEKAAAVDIGILLSQDVYRALNDKFPERSVDSLRKNVDIDVSDQFMIDIHVRDKDPDLAAAIANALPVLYRQFHVTALRGRLTGVSETLEQQLTQFDAEIADTSRQIQEMKVQTGVIDPGTAEARLANAADAFARDLDQTQTELEATAERVRGLKQQLEQGRVAGMLVGTDSVITPDIEIYLSKITQLEVQEAGLPDPSDGASRDSVRTQIDATREQLQKAVQGVIASQSKLPTPVLESLRQQLVSQTVEHAYLAAKRYAIAGALARLTTEKPSLVSASGDLARLTQRLTQMESIREEMTRNLMEAKLQLQDPPVEVVIVQSGVPPTRPVFPLPVLNTVVAALTGIAVGCYYALLMGYLARLKRARIRREMDWSPFLDGRFADFARNQATAGATPVVNGEQPATAASEPSGRESKPVALSEQVVEGDRPVAASQQAAKEDPPVAGIEEAAKA